MHVSLQSKIQSLCFLAVQLIDREAGKGTGGGPSASRSLLANCSILSQDDEDGKEISNLFVSTPQQLSDVLRLNSNEVVKIKL